MPAAATVRAACALALLAVPAVATAAPRVGGELTYAYDSNVNNARQGFAEFDSTQALARASVEGTWKVVPALALRFETAAQAQQDMRFEELSNARGTVLGRALWRADGAFYTPTVVLSGAASFVEYGSRLRDSAEYRASLHAIEQLTTRLSARVGAAATWRHAHGDVFDLDSHSLLADIDWDVLRRVALYVGYQYREGDLVSTGVPSPTVLAAARAIAPDDAFTGVDARLFAFRLPADAQVGTAGINIAITRELAVDVQAQFVEAEADLGSRYRHRLLLGSLLLRF